MKSIFENMDLESFYKNLTKEHKMAVYLYVIDEEYDFEENSIKDQELNENVKKFLTSDKEIAKIIFKTIDDDNDNDVDNSEIVRKLVDDFKRLRERKLERILNTQRSRQSEEIRTNN